MFTFLLITTGVVLALVILFIILVSYKGDGKLDVTVLIMMLTFHWLFTLIVGAALLWLRNYLTSG